MMREKLGHEEEVSQAPESATTEQSVSPAQQERVLTPADEGYERLERERIEADNKKLMDSFMGEVKEAFGNPDANNNGWVQFLGAAEGNGSSEKVKIAKLLKERREAIHGMRKDALDLLQRQLDIAKGKKVKERDWLNGRQ